MSFFVPHTGHREHGFLPQPCPTTSWQQQPRLPPSLLGVRAHDIVDKFLTEAWLTTSLTFLCFIGLQNLQPT